MKQLTATRGQQVPRAVLARLAGLGQGRLGLTLDLQALDSLGAPVVIVRPPDRAPAWAAALTPREREVASLVAAGLRNKDIALALGISVGTVKDHVHRVLVKSGLDSRAGVGREWGEG
ncbi:MAG: helix-turn-helix transcriptional regulator [Alphaproteobacteria bacterium]|nr:helix-turn-helix transcriptional regulator [Alphaproteobacteria bacterium]